jgi:hypothetical protein
LNKLNKTQVIAPLVALVVVGVIFSLYTGRKNHQHFVSAHVRQIGTELIETTNSPWLVSIGDGLNQELAQLLGSATRVSDVHIGDEPAPIGDGSADSRLLLVNKQGKRLGIRLRQDSDPEQFHVLGYWNLDNSGVQK